MDDRTAKTLEFCKEYILLLILIEYLTFDLTNPKNGKKITMKAKNVILLMISVLSSSSAFGMKRFQNEPPRSPKKPLKKVLIASPTQYDQSAFIQKIEHEIYADSDPAVMGYLLSQPEARLLSDANKKALYEQAEALEKMLETPATDPSHIKITTKKNLLYAFTLLPNFSFPQVFFTPIPYQRLTDKRPLLKDILIALIKNEQEEIYISSFHLTLGSVGQALVEQKDKGVVVQVITNQLDKNNPKLWMLPAELQYQGISVVSPQNDNFEQMHHKFFIFKKNLLGKSLLVTGSYNPTGHSDTHSWDDIIIIDDQDMINTYLERFNEIKKRSK